MSYTITLPDGRLQLQKDRAFCELLNDSLPPSDKLLTELISEFDSTIRTAEPSITNDALKNAHGDWYEWLLGISAWNCYLENPTTNLTLPLPNITQLDVVNLYNPSLKALIDDLKVKLIEISGVRLITSNPDFVIIDRSLVEKIMPSMQHIDQLTPESLEKLDNAYLGFLEKCSFENLVGYASVKSSFRPDRRLQCSHEGSLMKAIYAHLQTRLWVINPKGLKYYAISTRVSGADRTGLKTVATHSIPTVHSLPQAAVDDAFEINSLLQAAEVFKTF